MTVVVVSSTSPLPLAPVGPGLLVEVRRTRTPMVPRLAEAGTVKLIVRLELLEPDAMSVLEATCSPLSDRLPFPLKSIQALRKAEEPLTFVTLTIIELVAPGFKKAGNTMPSSSARSVMSSPVAELFVTGMLSASVNAPI